MGLTHIVFSIFFYGATASIFNLPITRGILAIVAFGALVPDIDNPTSSIGMLFLPLSKWINKRYGHRTITHSLWFWLGGTCLSLAIAYPVGELTYAVAFSMGTLSHLIADGMTKTGVMLFWPNSRPVYFIPQRLTVKTNSRQELVVFIIFSFLAVSTVGIYYIGWRSVFRSAMPTFVGARNLYLEKGCREGEAYRVFVKLTYCEGFCYDLEGEIIGAGYERFYLATPRGYFEVTENRVPKVYWMKTRGPYYTKILPLRDVMNQKLQLSPFDVVLTNKVPRYIKDVDLNEILKENPGAEVKIYKYKGALK